MRNNANDGIKIIQLYNKIYLIGSAKEKNLGMAHISFGLQILWKRRILMQFHTSYIHNNNIKAGPNIRKKLWRALNAASKFVTILKCCCQISGTQYDEMYLPGINFTMSTWFHIQIASKLGYHPVLFSILYKTWQYHKVAQEHIRPSEQDWKKEKNILEE